MEEVSESKLKQNNKKIETSIKTSGGFFRQIRSLDIYPKLDENYRIQTSGGAVGK